MKVDFRRLTWENYPSTETPISADNLNRLEEGVAGLYSDVAEIEEDLSGGVGEYVTDWLSEHVDPVGSAVVVDDALVIAGAAADAKKTGDEISGLKEDFDEIRIGGYNLFNPDTVSENTFVDDSGNISSSDMYYLSDYIEINGAYTIKADGTSPFRICKYNDNKVFQSREWTNSNPYTGTINGYIRLLLQNEYHPSDHTDPETVIVNKGAVSLPFEPYYSAKDYVARYYGLAVDGDLPTGSDLNTLESNRIYSLVSGGSYGNCPISDSGFLINIKITPTFGFQVVIQSYSGKSFMRRIMGNAWDEWRQVTNTTNTTYKLAMFGDSISWGQVGGQASGVQSPTPIPYWVHELTGINVTNYGVGGMGWLSTQYYDQNALEYIPTVDLSAYRCVSFAYGINDSDKPLGTYTDTGNTTIMGAIYQTFAYMKANYPNKTFILITPTIGTNWAGTFPKWNWYKQRTGGWTLEDMTTEYEKFCNYYHVPCISLRESPINSFNAETLLGDGVHPNNIGYELLGKYIAGKIGSIIG